MTSSPSSHLLLVAFPAWGHIRPLCVLAARIVAENENNVVTIVATPPYFEKMRFEIVRQFEDGSPQSQRVRLVSIQEPTAVAPLAAPDLVAEAFAQAYAITYESLSAGKAITCLASGTVFEAIPAPVAVVIDFFCLSELKATRALTGNTVPIISWVTGGSATLLLAWGPESLGGYGDLSAKIQAEADRTGKSVFEVGNKVYHRQDGKLIKLPGVPALYDYEFHPQKLPFEMPLALVINAGREFLKDHDAMLIASSDLYEKESLDAVRAWQSEQGKSVHVVGPLLPFVGAAYVKPDVNEENSNIVAFLDSILGSHGKRSVIFISFGSTFWPATPDFIDEVINALIEKKFPFILSHGSAFARVPLELSEKIQASGIGLSTSWSPQQFILNHPATGWFLTHGGHGGITESLGSGVPLICWPFDADQPTAAAHITDNLKVGFELHEVKTNLVSKVLNRTGKAVKGTREAVGEEIRRVFDACRSNKGAQVRQNAERLKREFVVSWEEGGVARIALQEFTDKYARA